MQSFLRLTECRPRVNGLARVDERGVCFVVVPIKIAWECGMH